VLESVLTKKILKALESEVGGWWMKVHGGPYQAAGVPDLLGCVNGKFIALEVKRPGNRRGLTPLQAEVISQIKENGGVACKVESVREALKAASRLLEV